MNIKEESQLLTMSTDVVKAFLVTDAKDYFVEDAIVLNLSSLAVLVGSPELSTFILPWKSARLINTVIPTADCLVIFNVQPNSDLKTLAEKWDWFGLRLPSFPKSTQLHISPIDSIRTVDLNLSEFTGRQFSELGSKQYEIRLNLWFAPEGTDCGIHNTHNFLEIHTQIIGTGRIEKFKTSDDSTKFEDLFLTEGFTHQFFGDLKDGNPTYCWHRYIAETDCVWLAIEFHPLS